MDTLYGGFLVLLLTWSTFLYFSPRARAREPPGPRGRLFFGNEFQIPKDKQWLKFYEWSQSYGDIVQITTMRQPVVILNSAEAAYDLLEMRGSIYSDRPKAVMAGELVGWDRGLGYATYGDRFKEFRKMFHHTMGPRHAHELTPLQERETARLMLRLLDRPEAFIEHARQSTGATILMLAYGYTVDTDDDPLVKIAEEAMLGFSKASEPGAFIVDRFPMLKHLPAWIPGARFQETAKHMRADLERLYDVPFNFVQQQMGAGREIPSFTSKYLSEKQNPSEEEKAFVKAAAASLYSGGADTTPSTITAFILALVLNPEVQARGQAEIDSVLGSERLPTLSDRESLPYVNAIVKEVLRWNPVVPLGLPHQLTEDDTYRGYRIPKGAIVWANIWAMLHDERHFPDSHAFKAERFLQDGKLLSCDRLADPSMLAFGFGRRICPGMLLADNSIFITIASILMVFDITKAKDKQGNSITPEVDFRGFISHPVPFCCTIRPRSKAVADLVRKAVEAQSL